MVYACFLLSFICSLYFRSSFEHIRDFLQYTFALGGVFPADGSRHAGIQVVFQYGRADLIERRLHRLDLADDVNTIGILFHHPDNTAMWPAAIFNLCKVSSFFIVNLLSYPTPRGGYTDHSFYPSLCRDVKFARLPYPEKPPCVITFEPIHEGERMPSIAIITDTDSSLPLDLAREYHIVEVPIIVQFGEESFRMCSILTMRLFFARADREGRLPKTAAPSLENSSKRTKPPLMRAPIKSCA